MPTWNDFSDGKYPFNYHIACIKCDSKLIDYADLIPHNVEITIQGQTDPLISHRNSQTTKFINKFMISSIPSKQSMTNILRSPQTIRDPSNYDYELENPRLTNTALSKNLISSRPFKSKTKEAECNCVFIKMVEWVTTYNLRNGVKIICPNCSSVVGFGKSSGLKCCCGHWKKPGVQLIKQFCKINHD